jgi:MFS family permease
VSRSDLEAIAMPIPNSFRSVRNPNYRRYFAGQLISLSGTWAQQIGLGWLVLDLSDDSGVAVGIVTALQFVPVLLLGLWAGLLADRFDKRRFIAVTQVALASIAGVLAIVDLSGNATLPIVYVLAFVFGVATAFDTPARLSFVVEMVGSRDLPNALALNSAVVNGGRIIGPAIAGGLIAVGGTGLCFGVNALSYVGTIVAVLSMDRSALHQSPAVTRKGGQVREGIRYTWNTPVLRASVLLMGSVSLLAFNYPVLLPLLAKITFEGSASTYSLFASSMGVGALIAALVLANLDRPYGRRIILATCFLGAATLASSIAPGLAMLVVLLGLTGIGQVVTASSVNALVQLDADPDKRGRVTAIFALTSQGVTPVGGVVAGTIAEMAGPRWAMAVGGAGALIAALVFGPTLFAHHRHRERAAVAL